MHALRKLFRERAVERAALLIAVGFLLIVSIRSQQEHASASGENAVLAAQMERQTAQLERLQEEYFRTRYDLAKLQQGLAVNASANTSDATTPAEEPLILGWAVEGEALLAEEYNAAIIQEHEAVIAELELRYEAAEEGKEGLREEIRDLERQVRELREGEPKYALHGVQVSIENPRSAAAEVIYTLCWVQLDCRTVYAKGALTAPPGTNSSHMLPLDIPKMMTIDKQRLVLRFTVTDDATVLFSDDYVILSPALAQ